jgi:GntR family transcriptional repressor for pyruvate dehydrogenase complex
MTRDIIWKISRNELSSGERLPSIEKMASDYGVARSTIREAIKYMESTGLVYSVHGKGTFITTYVPSSNGIAFLDHIVELRKMIEIFSIKQAAFNRSSEDIKRMEELLALMAVEIKYPKRFIEVDREFHIALSRASGNPFIPNMLENISGLFAGVQDAIVDVPDYPYELISEDHVVMVEAIKNQDTKLAEETMNKHLEYILTITARKLNV